MRGTLHKNTINKLIIDKAPFKECKALRKDERWEGIKKQETAKSLYKPKKKKKKEGGCGLKGSNADLAL